MDGPATATQERSKQQFLFGGSTSETIAGLAMGTGVLTSLNSLRIETATEQAGARSRFCARWRRKSGRVPPFRLISW